MPPSDTADLMLVWQHRLEGVILFFTALALLAGLVGHMVPDTPQAVAINLRILDNLRPHLMLVALVGAGALAVMGQPRLGLGIAALSVLGWVWMFADYRARIAPPAPPSGAEVTVLWFNLLQENQTDPDEIEAALRGSGADLIILAEALPAHDLLPRLSDIYPHRSGCSTPERCELAILSRHPMGPITFESLPFGHERLARFVLQVPEGPQPTIVAVHRVKPWYLGLTDTGEEWLNAVLSGPRHRPLILMGDFNATPWSRRMWTLGRTHGMVHGNWPIATWPVRAGRLGLPIDHILLRGPTGFAEITPWGADLGSNHSGLRARVRITPTMGDGT